ncbi:IS5 family transposase [Uliginosibacterium paludis]|uniref:IS5 family transposase n=1 Tax=Uliginosibacterium paludis TaxID=1615952 RepID=A0ABV2CLW1_9RHOO
MSKPPKPKYRTTNWSAYNESLRERGALLLWSDKDMEWAGAPSGKRGCSPSFSDAAVQFCLMIKNLYGLALRQTTGMVRSLLKLAGLDWDMPDCSTLSRRHKHLQATLTHQRRGEALHLLVDSTGIKMLGEGEWKRKKHGADYRRQWRKVHLGIDAQTLEVRAIEVTANSVGDAPMLPALLEQIPPDEPIESVGADGAYDTKACHAAIASRGGERADSRAQERETVEGSGDARARNEILRTTYRLGRAIWKKWSGYHRRSLVETKMRCFKLLGERVMARDFDRQVAELKIRAALLNRFTQLGTPQTVRAA